MLLKWRILVFSACAFSILYIICNISHLSTRTKYVVNIKIDDIDSLRRATTNTSSTSTYISPHIDHSIVPHVCIITASSSRKTNWEAPEDSYVAKIMYPSIVNTIEPHLYRYSVFVGYDADDSYWNNSRNRFQGITWVSVQNPLHKPGPVFNHVAKQAYLQHCDYYFRINDDTQVLSANWTTTMITLLQQQLNNTGVVGPVCHQGNTAIFTHDFVHKTHLKIFKNYYNPAFPDWWLDDWITNVYKKLNRTIVASNVEVVHNLKETRYQVSTQKQNVLAQEVEKDTSQVRTYLSLQK